MLYSTYITEKYKDRQHICVIISMLLLNLIKSWCNRITDRSRFNNNTIIRQNKTLFQNERKIF